ncbi:MAG: hypothetical protein HQL65_02635 [Magnetococcales bacterium]|nr:hypothetical protein [Magnetococcales bacterium]
MFHGLDEYKQKLIQDSWQKGIDDGRKKGIEEGKKEGKKEQAIIILRYLFEKKFSSGVPGWIEEKLVHATLEELEGWTLRTWDAQSPEELFTH